MKSLLPPELQPAWSIRDTKTRRERLAELAFAGYRIPRCGAFRDMVRLGVPLVVYADDCAHCGEGKVLFKHGGFIPDWPADTFCSEYMPDDCDRYTDRDDGVVFSYRHLFVGSLRFHLRYESVASWMSNVNGQCNVLYGPEEFGRDTTILPYPMFAIDYTLCRDTCYHFDLNTCPGVPLEVVNMVGRDVLTESVAKLCRDRGLVS